jgi:hypothetical protein
MNENTLYPTHIVKSQRFSRVFELLFGYDVLRFWWDMFRPYIILDGYGSNLCDYRKNEEFGDDSPY